MWYDSEEIDSWFNIKCCDRHIHEPYRVRAFRLWNSEDVVKRNYYDEQFHYHKDYSK